jgi:hypothetical protein
MPIRIEVTDDGLIEVMIQENATWKFYDHGNVLSAMRRVRKHVEDEYREWQAEQPKRASCEKLLTM